MTCACCETGRCCGGPLNADCQSGTKSQCASSGGDFTAGSGCGNYACTDDTYRQTNCFLSNPCACSSTGYSPHPPYTTCNCNTLAAAGVPSGGCASFLCFACNPLNGGCEYSCPSPRECCAGVCCPESQTCPGNVCINKCSSGTTYCSGGFGAYACCSSTQKCCGAQGCLPTVQTATKAISTFGTQWIDSGLDSDGTNPVTWTATGTVTSNSTSLNPQVTVGPGGWVFVSDSNDIITSCKYVQLMGRVGASNATIFCMSSNGSTTPTVAGRIYLAIYGGISYQFSGTFTVTLSTGTDPCPGYSPASLGEPIVHGSDDQPPPLPGPGAALKSLLKLAGIAASPTCSCNARALQMDQWREWACLKRLPEITGWLKEEAEKREMWFWAPAGVAVILAAIALSALKRPFRDNNK